MTPELAVALGAAGYAAYRNCLVGNPAPMVRCYFDRASNPRPGDLVVGGVVVHAAVSRWR
jgi:hypothetical protein